MKSSKRGLAVPGTDIAGTKTSNGPSRRSFLIGSAVVGAVAGSAIAWPVFAQAVGGLRQRTRLADDSQTFTVVRNGSDTSVIQKQLDAAAASVTSGVATVIVPYDGSDWLTKPLFIGWHTPVDPFRTGAVTLHLIFEPGVVVRANLPEFAAGSRMITIGGHKSAQLTSTNHGYSAWGIVISGYGAFLDGNDPDHTLDSNEEYQQNSAIFLASAGNVLVEGLTLQNTPGDGIEIESVKNNADINNYSGGAGGTNPVHVINVSCHNNGRNGMSVCAVDGLLVTGCSFTGASSAGHAGPNAGIDFEPDRGWIYGVNDGTLGHEYGRLADILIQDCVMENNVNCGVQLQAAHLKTATSVPDIDITLDRVMLGAQQRPLTAGQNQTYPNFLVAGDGRSVIGGKLTLQNSLIATAPVQRSMLVANNWSGGPSASAGTQPTHGILLSLTNSVCIDWNNSLDAAGDHVIDISADDYDNGGPMDCNRAPCVAMGYGHVEFNNFLVVTNVSEPFLVTTDAPNTPASAGAANLTGTLHVVDPKGGIVSIGKNSVNTAFTQNPATAMPNTTVTMSMTPSQVPVGQPIKLTVTRTGGDLSRPLAVTYALSGTAKERYDYDGLPGVVVIPAGETSQTVSFTARRIDSGTDSRSVTVTLTPTPAVSTYTLASGSSIQATALIS
ncbi:right-handed parallel beta-helix repeat-containing protein [Paraburkholderia acidicola]|uniref:right-handed parallel beta-helix repeat-containing protein n=1 Tax=Paraburkholderia acidicola TaxID=1912599 RepID=UPI001056D71E|nr:right-handed parallel beta-helix repeat-containing protein [Paraburkholderia acidicola]